MDLPDGITDDDYLAWLDNALSSGLRQFTPELICYIAGADPYREDQLGGLGLTTGQVGFVYGTIGIIALTCGGLLGGFRAPGPQDIGEHGSELL